MSETNVVQFRPREETPEADPRLLSVEKLKTRFKQAEEAHQEPRKLAFRDRDYYDNYDDNQWTEYEKKKLKQRRQQISTSNKIKKKVNSLLGYEKQNRTDPKAWPRSPDQEQAADIAVDALDYIENNVKFDRLASQSASNLAIEAIEAVEVTFDPDKGRDGGEIDATRIRYDRFFYDPHSLEQDFSDARYMGYTEWLDEDVAKARYEGKDEFVENSFRDQGDQDEGYSDKPWDLFALKEQRRVRVVVMYYKAADDTWMLAHFTGAGILFEGVSPWVDEDGPACGIIAQSLYINRQGYRFGLVRDDISIQNDINQRKSKSLHLLSDRRTWGVDGWTQDENAAKEGMARPDGHVSVTGPMGSNWGLMDSTAEAQGNFELLQQSVADMEIQGVYTPGDSGRAQDQSGRAIIALQQAGLVGEGHFFDAHDEWKQRCYRRFWFMAKKFWDAPRFIRITKDENAPRFVGINQPVGADQLGRPIIQNPISQIDVDIVIETGQDTVVLQHEQFELLVQMLPQLAQMPMPFAVALIEASQLRNKEKIIQAIEQMAQSAGPDPIEAAKAEADIKNKNAQTQKTQVETAKMFGEAAAGPEPKGQPQQ